MDWIEHFFHVAPDGGNGTLEAFIGIAVTSVSFLGWLSRRLHRRGLSGRHRLENLRASFRAPPRLDVVPHKE